MEWDNDDPEELRVIRRDRTGALDAALPQFVLEMIFIEKIQPIRLDFSRTDPRNAGA